MVLGETEETAKIGEECDRSFAEACWHWLRYEKSQMEFRVGIEECDRASIPVNQ
jgi:hypothetical protein